MTAWVMEQTDAPLLRAVDAVREVLDRPGFVWSDGEVLEQLRQLNALVAVAHAAKLTLVHELEVRPDPVPGAAAGKAAVTFLTEGLRESRTQAQREIAAARALVSADAELPRLALAAGEVSPEHVNVAVSAL